MNLIAGLQVKVLAREIYGRKLYYPVNEPAQILTKLTNSKTFTEEQLAIIGKIAAIHVVFNEGD